MTEAEIAQMLADADLNDSGTHQVYLGDWVRALAAEVTRRIDPADHEQTVQACLAYERENDALRIEDANLRAQVAELQKERDEARASLAFVRGTLDISIEKDLACTCITTAEATGGGFRPQPEEVALHDTGEDEAVAEAIAAAERETT